MIPQNLLTDVPIYAQNAQEIVEPTNQTTGHEVGQTLPAAWWNWLWHRQTQQHNSTKTVTDAIIVEINNVLQNQQIEPSAEANNQLVEAIYKITQQALKEPTENISSLQEALTALEERMVLATPDKDGLMSRQDKAKLDGIAEEANKYELPTASPTVLGGIKIGQNLEILEDGTLNAQAGGVGLDSLPIGFIVAGLAQANSQWLLVDGRELEINDYPDLASHFERVFGAKNYFGGDGVTTFKLPDMREVVLVGSGTNTQYTIAAHDVYQIGEFKDDQFQGHEHVMSTPYYRGAGEYGVTGDGRDSKTSGVAADNVNGTPRIGSTTHGKQLGVNYFIKARNVVNKQSWTIGQGLQLVDRVLSVNSTVPYASETVPGIAMFAPIPED